MLTEKQSITCRVCFEGADLEHLVSPCKCKGTLAFVHVSCLEHWLLESMSSRCELCQFPFRTQQALQYTLHEAVLKWLFNIHCCSARISRNAISSLIATPITLLCFYFCVLIADYYYMDRLNELPIGTVTILLLFILVSIMGLGYVAWMYFRIQFKFNLWFRWWQSKMQLKIILDDNESCISNYLFEANEPVQEPEPQIQVHIENTNGNLQ